MMSEKLENFKIYWEDELREVVYGSIKGDVDLLAEYNTAENEKEKDIVVDKMYKTERRDWIAVNFIGQMLYYIEHDLEEDKNPGSRMLTVLECLGNPDYYKAFSDKPNCKEVLLYKTLAIKLKEGMDLLI